MICYLLKYIWDSLVIIYSLFAKNSLSIVVFSPVDHIISTLLTVPYIPNPRRAMGESKENLEADRASVLVIDPAETRPGRSYPGRIYKNTKTIANKQAAVIAIAIFLFPAF